MPATLPQLACQVRTRQQQLVLCVQRLQLADELAVHVLQAVALREESTSEGEGNRGTAKKVSQPATHSLL